MHENFDTLHPEHMLLPGSFLKAREGEGVGAGGVQRCLIHFSINTLHYNQYHQYQMKLDRLRKWCVEAVLSHF